MLEVGDWGLETENRELEAGKLSEITQEDLGGGRRPFECVTGPGEVMFVPSGWWHCVLNIEESVAITHNFV